MTNYDDKLNNFRPHSRNGSAIPRVPLHETTMSSVCPGHCAWAVSYIGLGVTCGLLSSLEDQCALLEHARTIPPLEIAMRRAFKATASPMQTR